MEKGDEGDRGGWVEQDVNDILFYLLSSGIPEPVIYGYHTGWEFERLMDCYFFLRKREVEQQQSAAHMVALGASTLFKGEPLKKFQRETDKLKKSLSTRRTDFLSEDKEEQQRRDASAFNALKGMGGFDIL